MSTLLIDNYDSYTYNVFHLLAAASGEEPLVVHNDMVSWRALSRWDFDAIVLSPGPGRPDRWHDFGVCSDILRNADVPVLGICLGHQGLGHALDAAVVTAPIAMHGRLSEVEHSGTGLFAGIPQGFSVVRYHSLAVTRSRGGAGRVTAWTPDGVVMGLEHTERPMWGVQFHPESIATEHGHRLIENFYELASAHRTRRRRRHPPLVPPRRCRKRASGSRWRVARRTVACEADPERLFQSLFGSHSYAFWLDSADTSSALGSRSFMGASDGPNRSILRYDVTRQVVTDEQASATRLERCSIFDLLERVLGKEELQVKDRRGCDLLGGYVGYIGYECKADCGSTNRHRSHVPDAILLFANRIVSVDHDRGETTLLALHDDSEEREANEWLDFAERALSELLDGAGEPEPLPAPPLGGSQRAVAFTLGRGREQYLADIARSQAALNSGESYEVCLTDQLHSDARPDPWRLYRILRRRNPAPFGAYLKLGDVSVMSSSPERFLSVDRERHVQARPIKGTTPRGADSVEDQRLRELLQSDEKTFAEHLMIVDLLRNDLGRVCEVDSVAVPELMIVESYRTVNQLISNVTGTLEPSRSPVESVRACFPGGSMTGAPKLRTMEIIDDIEREARGVYSGAIGYFGLDGCVDLSIVIRTIVMSEQGTSIGAGGAIVTQSDAEEEVEELLLKASAPMRAVAEAVTGRRDPAAVSLVLEPTRPAHRAAVGAP
jgi:para-aminobenzoate synthetase